MKTYEFNSDLEDDNGGFCYMLFLSTGIVKAGKTKNLVNRFKQHLASVQKKGVDINHIVFTDWHEHYSKNEKIIF